MNKEPSNKAWVGCASAAAVVIAAIIALGQPFAHNIASRILPPATPVTNTTTSTLTIPVTMPTVTSQPLATEEHPISNTLPVLTPIQVQTLALCYGQCWQYDNNNLTMTWTGLSDGTEDIWQPPGEALEKIRSGYTAIISASVPGEIFACVLSINGEVVKDSCDGALYQVSPGTYQITSSNSSIGGFRWCPMVGYGWRKNGGECR